METLKISNEIAHFYRHLFSVKPKAQHIVLHSGRCVTKSVFLSLWDIWRLFKVPKAEVQVLAYEFSSIKDKVYKQYLFALQLLKVPKKLIDAKCNEHETYIKLKTKWGINTIRFSHGKYGAESLKGLAPTPGWRWLAVRFYELTNFENWNSQELTKAIATFIRDAHLEINWKEIQKYCEEWNIEFIMDYNWLCEQEWFRNNWEKYLTGLFCITYEFNTPGAKAAWIFDWLEIRKSAQNTYYQFNTYLDLTDAEKFKFLGPQMLQEITNEKEINPLSYDHEYLGKIAYEGDIVWPQLNENSHYGKYENFIPDLLVIGVDVGQSDPTVCTLNGFEFREKDFRFAFGMHRWSHCNRRSEYIKDGRRLPFKVWEKSQYLDFIIQFYDMVHNEYPHAYVYFQMDYANEGVSWYQDLFSLNSSPLYLNVTRSWEKVPIPERVAVLAMLLGSPGTLKIYDPILYNAIRNQLYGKKDLQTGERKLIDDPTRKTMDMDSLDSMFYGILKPMYQQIKERLLLSKGKFVSSHEMIVKNYNNFIKGS